MLEVIFDKKIETGEKLTIEQTRSKPDISWDSKVGRLYTIIIYDLDSPYPKVDDMSDVYLHLLVVNLPDKGEVVASYVPPSPPEDSPKHRYIIAVYKQKGEINIPVERIRARFNLDQFEIDHDLKRVDHLLFYVKNNPKTYYKTDTTYYGEPEHSESEQMTKKQKSYCRCILHVAAKNTRENNRKRNWNRKRGNVNPYSVCSSRVKPESQPHHCFQYHDLNSLPDVELIALADLKRLDISGFDREEIIDILEKYKNNPEEE